MTDLLRYIVDLSDLIDYIESCEPNPELDALQSEFTLPKLKADLQQAEAVAGRVTAYSKSLTTMMGEIKRDDDDFDQCNFCTGTYDCRDCIAAADSENLLPQED